MLAVCVFTLPCRSTLVNILVHWWWTCGCMYTSWFERCVCCIILFTLIQGFLLAPWKQEIWSFRLWVSYFCLKIRAAMPGINMYSVCIYHLISDEQYPALCILSWTTYMCAGSWVCICIYIYIYIYIHTPLCRFCHIDAGKVLRRMLNVNCLCLKDTASWDQIS